MYIRVEKQLLYQYYDYEIAKVLFTYCTPPFDNEMSQYAKLLKIIIIIF